MRIQILPLPSIVVGDDVQEPFALVFDQADDSINKELLASFAHLCGAKNHIIVPQTVEVVDRYAGLAVVDQHAATPATAHELHRQADRETGKLAWLHQCGHLNQGYWHDGSVCGSCRFSVEHAREVTEHYRLVPVEVLTGDDGAQPEETS
ncbi:MAG: hypothetical protein ABR585_07580 [Gemmatimonadaceae bacterium]